MRIKTFLCAVLAMAGLMMSVEVNAQSTTTTIWNGVAYSSAQNKTILLYNVGTGRLLIHGGDWGTQARLFYQNWGDKLTLKYSSGAYSITTPFDKYFTVNVPSVTSAKTSWDDPAEVWQPIMDGSGSYSGASTGSYSINLTFERIEGETGNTTYTYYIRQTPKSGSTYYIGAAYGMTSATSFMDELGDDECAYTTETYAKATTTYTIGDATQVSAQALYQWRIILFDDYEEMVTRATDELSANISYEIFDQDFTRNVNSFYDNWKAISTNATGNATSQGSGRFIYTWGFSAQGTRQRHRNWYGTAPANSTNPNLRVSGKWCTPIRLKEQFSDDWIWSYVLYGCTSENAKNNLTTEQQTAVSRGQMKDAKYGYMSFEGIGAVYSSITAPATGWYQVSCIGFSQSATQNRGYLFAASSNSPVDPSTLDYTDDKYAKAFLNNVAAGTYDRTSYMECMGDNTLNTNLEKVGAGYVLTRQQDDFRTTVLMYANAGDQIYFGVGKDAGTPTIGYENYYYDADWAPTDNYQIVFLGDNVVVFDEEETSIDYLKASNGDDKIYTNTTARLKRTFVKNSWNSFVFPIDLTSRQLKEAFGSDMGLAELVSIGSLSGLADCIDFKSVQLPADNNSVALEAGKFYIIKPTADPAEIDGKKYYVLGTHTFNTSNTGMNANGGWDITNPVVSSDYFVVDQEKTQGSPSFDQYKDNQIKWYATYVSSGTNTSVPAKSYVLGNNDGSANTPTKMYHLTKDTKILGFRGWIRDKADIEGTGSSGAKDLNIFVTNSFDETSGISTIPVTLPYMNNVIYDISGRQVGKISGTTVVLPREKGMYIVNGKKFIVK